MLYLRRFFPTAIIILFVFALAACGNSTSTGSGGGNSGYGGSTPAATTSSSSTALINTTTATVNGKSEMILTDAQGKALYYFTPDTASTSACTGGCASNWPPLLSSGSGTPSSATTLPGTLTVVTTANGSQVAYNGHLLYTFAADTGPGQVTGDGKGGKWFVATPDLTTGSAGGSGSGSGSTALVMTKTATVAGKSETILTDAQGMTLYYFTPDTATTTACTGGCASNWPPLLMTGSGTPSSATTLPGKLTIVMTANGNQVEYNGHFLYTFKADTAPGQTNGQNVNGKWFVATPDLK